MSGSYELCEGIGGDAFEFMENILAGYDGAFEEDEEITPFQVEYDLELDLTIGNDDEESGGNSFAFVPGWMCVVSVATFLFLE